MVEARDLSAISSFSLYQSLMSFSFKTQVESTDRLPNVITTVNLKRDGFKTQKRKTMVEKVRVVSPLPGVILEWRVTYWRVTYWSGELHTAGLHTGGQGCHSAPWLSSTGVLTAH